MEASWKAKLESEFDRDYMKNLRHFLKGEYDQGKVIYPRKSEYFAAFDWAPYENVKVVILGQTLTTGPTKLTGFVFQSSREFLLLHPWSTFTKSFSRTWEPRDPNTVICKSGRSRVCFC